MTTEKLIDDAVQAFDDRGITAPPREHLRVALDAFDASLSKCGCEACTIVRRERIALTEHDRTAVARALHEIVYSPGANFDRAVPGIQEYMLERAEKVVAALPWIAPHTPTDDEREALARLIRNETGEAPEESGFVADAILAAGFRRSEVPESSAGRELTPCGNLVCTGCRVCGCPALGIEPQGEPSDAQVLAALNAFRPWLDPGKDVHREVDRKQMRAALRAAWGVR